MKKTALLVLIALILCIVLVSCQSQDDFIDESPITGGVKAIIFVPGIMGSQLYNEDTGQFIWDFFTEENLSDCTQGDNLIYALKNEASKYPKSFLRIINDIIAQNDQSIIAQMLSDQNGDLINETTKAYPDSDDRRQYGGFACYETTMKVLKETYGDKYEVKFFNYNWLTDVRLAAEALKKFVLDNNYTEIILIAHSMGGLVTTSYLTDLQNRRRVAKNILIASPLYGSAYALDALESNDYFGSYLSMLESVLKVLPLGKLGSALSEMLGDLRTGALRKLIANSSTVFQLLPSSELGEYYADMITVDNESVDTGGLIDFYKNRKWAKKDDGDVHGGLLKYNALRSFLYANYNGKKVFASELADTYYIAGTGYNTAYKVNYKSNESYSLEYLRDGDGTVLLKSATLGKEIDNDHVFAVHGSHSIGNNLDGECKEIVFSIIDK